MDTKISKKILVGPIKDYLKQLLFKKAAEIDCKIEAIEIDVDHLHIFIKSKPTITVSDIVKNLKGYTSYFLRKRFIELKKYRQLWTSSYYCETIGFISEHTVKKYIERHKNKHNKKYLNIRQ